MIIRDVPRWLRRRGSQVVLLGCCTSLLLLAACGRGIGATSSEEASHTATSDAKPPITAPHSVAELVQFVNGLPRPVTLANFLTALPHPLALNATTSQFSLQPAIDANNPRIFIVNGPLILSIVPIGPNANIVEVGELTDTGAMVSSQLDFPVVSQLTPSDLYEKVLRPDGGGTICAQCHGAEVHATKVSDPHAFETGLFSPVPQLDERVDGLAPQAAACDAKTQGQRCDVFNALTSPTLPAQFDF